MKKILLTGGSGFIGRNIRESYLGQKYRIVAPSHAELDLADTACVDAFFAKNSFDCVLHAGVKPGHRNAKEPTDLLRTNLKMFLNLERNKDSFGRLINFGSGAIYNQGGDISGARETAIFASMPDDEHGLCKYCVHKIIERLPNFTDLIIFGIFGKYEDWQIRFISNALCKALAGLPITLRQNRRFSYLDVDDLCGILDLFISGEPKHKAYNIVPGGFVELAEVAKLAAAGTGAEIKIAQGGFGKDYYGSNARLEGEFGQIKFTPMRESVEKLRKYYADNAALIDKTLLLTDK